MDVAETNLSGSPEHPDSSSAVIEFQDSTQRENPETVNTSPGDTADRKQFVIVTWCGKTRVRSSMPEVPADECCIIL